MRSLRTTVDLHQRFLPESDYGELDVDRTALSVTFREQYVLDNLATVAEAVSWMDATQLASVAAAGPLSGCRRKVRGRAPEVVPSEPDPLTRRISHLIMSRAPMRVPSGSDDLGIRLDLTEVCNTAVRLHREHFGRGPGAAKAYVERDLLICVLTDVLTPPERALLAGGFGEKVLECRMLHQHLVEPLHRRRMEAVIHTPIRLYAGSLHVEEGFAIDTYVLADRAPSDR